MPFVQGTGTSVPNKVALWRNCGEAAADQLLT